MRITLVIILFLGFGMIPSSLLVQAAEERPVTSCVAIDNISAYPEYDFLYTGMYHFFFANTFTGNDVSLCGQNTGGVIAAIKKTDWEKVQYPDIAGGYVTAPENTGLFLISDTNIIFNDVEPAQSQVFTRNISLHITDLTEGVLTTTVVYTDTRDVTGTVLTQTGVPVARVVLDASDPTATVTRNVSIPPAVLASLIVLALITGRFVYRKFHK